MSKSYDIPRTSQGLTLEEADAEIASLLNALADARTESMRLRAALRSLVSYTQCHYVDGYCVQHSSPDPCEMAEARAALEGK